MATAKQSLVTSTPDILGGTPVFQGHEVVTVPQAG